jgi:hypothetical protein
MLAKRLRRIFEWLGRCIALLSSYLTWLNFYEFFVTLIDLVRPCLKICLSGVYVVRGFVETAMQYQQSWWLVYLGFFGIIALAVFTALHYYSNLLDDLFDGLFISDFVRQATL